MGSKRRSQGEGSIYFDEGRDRWIGQAWIDGRRRKVSAKTKAEATARLGRLIHGDEAERLADRRLTVAQLLEDWQSTALPSRNLSASTLERHRWAADKLTAELGKAKAANLDVRTVEKALARLADGSRGEPLAKASITKIRNTLAQAYAWAERRRAVTFNPARLAELPTKVAEPQQRRALSRDELERLLEVLDEHEWSGLFRCCAQLGLRPGEAAAVHAEAVDLKAGTLSVVRAVHREGGRTVVSDELKTARSRRTLEMPKSLKKHLGPIVQSTPEGLLWTNDRGGPIYSTSLRSVLIDASEAAGLSPAVRPNELRHTCASIMAEDGVPPHVLADLLGHTSTRMVDVHYRHRPAIIRPGTGGVEI